MKINYCEIQTKSNYLSLFRLFLAIPFFFLLDSIHSGYSYRLFIFGFMMLALFTDLADGWLARKYNEITELGKIIDPLADKILIGTIVIKLYLIGEISDFYFWVIILRDILIFLGGISVVLNFSEEAPKVYGFLYYLSISMSFISIIGYAVRGFELIKWKRKNEVV